NHLERQYERAIRREPRRSDAGGGRGTGALHQLDEGHAHLLQARDVGQVVLLLVDLVEADQEGRQFALAAAHLLERIVVRQVLQLDPGALGLLLPQVPGQLRLRVQARVVELDRKSTRLNSSHVKISYAVFCLKKKK